MDGTATLPSLGQGSPWEAKHLAGGWERFTSGLSSVSKLLLSAFIPFIAHLALNSSLVAGFSCLCPLTGGWL